MAIENKINTPVGGMTCAACQAGVQKALQRQPGVLDASVNLMTANAAVTFDPAVTRLKHLLGDHFPGQEFSDADVDHFVKALRHDEEFAVQADKPAIRGSNSQRSIRPSA